MRQLNIGTFFFLLLVNIPTFAQNGRLDGRIVDKTSNEPVPFANIIIYNTTTGTTSDLDGNFSFANLQPGFVRIQVSSLGYETTVSDEIRITNARSPFMEIGIQESSTELEEIEVKASPFKKREESPVSLRSIGISEIEKNPGGNRDISKVIQSLPGVAGSVSFRNDVIVRGGGPSENRFYLDEVEIPNLNHFATQGASGGPVGIINVDFVREVNFYSGAFPANRGNAMSSILDFRQIDGNREKMKYRATIGASDLALTIDGPLGEKTSLVASVRRSYLQFLFAALQLPFLPTYNDAQFKVKTRFDKKNELTLIGLGAIDQFDLNTDANETEEQRYQLGYLPVYGQWNYTLGAVYKHYREKGYHTFVVSRNHLNNTAYKYANNNEDSTKILDYKSAEIENKFRYENNIRYTNKLKINYGAGLEYASYTNATEQYRYPQNVSYDTRLNLVKYSAFGQISSPIKNTLLVASFGLRMDANNYSSGMSNPLQQLSPRLSLSYPLRDKWSLNFNTGRFYQLPAYTTLGFADDSGELLNKTNGLKYIEADHFVGGLEYRPNEKSKITLEGFYKNYRNYPFSVTDSIAIASKGSDYGAFGDEEVLPTGLGRAYGAEFYLRHTNIFKFNTLIAYTFVRSEFKDINGNYVPSAWDNRHLLSLTATRNFKGNWDVGFKYRFAGGSPYTPYDVTKSSYVSAWEASQQAYPDYSRFNTERLSTFSQLDIRVDKSYYFDKWSLMLYLDIQNVTNAKTDTPDILVPQTDANGNKIIANPDAALNEQQYVMKYIETDGSGTIIPSIGIMIEF